MNVEPKDRSARPPTVYDVAKLAGVSAQTVSRLVKGYDGIRPATRERVEAAIEELGYRPNQAARVLRTRRSRRIGALVHEMFEFGPLRLLHGAANEARSAGYSLDIVGVDNEDERAIEDAFRGYEEEQVAGILVVALTESVRNVVERRRPDVPLVIDPAESPSADPTTSETGAAKVANHLLELGHHRVGFLGGPEAWIPARQRRAAFLAQVQAGGGAVIREWVGDWTPASGDRAAADFDPESGITAVFAANDAMAIGFIHGLAARGIDVPGDVSVVGFDDIPEAAYVRPALTTVRPDFEGQGRTAIATLLATIESRPRVEAVHPSGELVVRSSTASVHDRAIRGSRGREGRR